MSRRRRGSNPRSTHEEGYDEYSHDDEDEWDESEEDHTTSSPSIPSRDQHDELAEEGVTRLFESEDDDSDGDEAEFSRYSRQPSLQRPNQEWVDFHHTITKIIKIVEESRLEESLRRLVVEDLTAQKKKAEKQHPRERVYSTSSEALNARGNDHARIPKLHEGRFGGCKSHAQRFPRGGAGN